MDLEADDMTVTAVFRDIVKLSLSMFIAFVVLNAFCYFYYHLPIHHDNDSGATDYKWTPNYSIRRGTEGFSFGRTNNDGHMNSFDWNQGDRVKILIMGNSHMEAGNVMPDESVASRLNSIFGDRSVYNIGTSGHQLITIANNIHASVRRYRPEKFIIINITSIYPSGEALNDHRLKAGGRLVLPVIILGSSWAGHRDVPHNPARRNFILHVSGAELRHRRTAEEGCD